MSTSTPRIIWQYWETQGEKPRFIDELRRLARSNAGVQLQLVTPESLHRYLPSIPDFILNIEELAHKADMIRSMLVMSHGGMWLDSDAIVLRDLNWLFDLLEIFEFVGFNDKAELSPTGPHVRVNCFLSRKNGRIVSEWVRRQHAKAPKTTFEWDEIGSNLLHPICLEYQESIKILPFELICPIKAGEAAEFGSRPHGIRSTFRVLQILRRCPIVMMSNHALFRRLPGIRNLSVEEIAEDNWLLSYIMRCAVQHKTFVSPLSIVFSKDKATHEIGQR